MKKLVYIAGPLTTGVQDRNTNRAIHAGDMVAAMGGVPLIPHLSTLWAMVSNREWSYESWMEVDFEYIRRCDALYRFSGKSPGADREVEFAKRLGIPVFTWIEEASLAEFLDDGSKNLG